MKKQTRSDRRAHTPKYSESRREFMLKSGAAISFSVLGSIYSPFGAEAAETTKNGGTLAMVVFPEPPTLAPYLSTAAPVGQVATKVYEGLLEYDFELKPLPSLAKSWNVSPDGKTVTFQLQEGVRFHDGKPFTSADVQHSIMEVLKKVHPRGTSTFREVEAIDTPDSHTAVLRLKNPAPYMFAALSGYESPMLPKHLLEGTDARTNPLANKPVGTGPFRFIEWRRGKYARLDKNPDYWRKGSPHVDRIVATFIADAQTRSAAVERGEVDYAAFNAVSYADASRMKQLPNIAITTKGYEFISPIVELEFNTTKKPFDNAKVRQAIAYAIDRKFIIDNIWFGFGKIATGPISSNFKASGLYTSDVKSYDVTNRLDIANRLLDAAGYKRGPDGKRFSMLHDVIPYGEEFRRLGEYVKSVLSQLGIEVSLRTEDVPTWLRRVYTNYDFDMTSNWIYTQADPVIGVQRQYWSKDIRPGTVFVNASRWSTPETDHLIEAAAIETDPKKRADLYHQFQKLVVEASPIIWVLESESVTVYRDKVKDATISPLGPFSAFDRTWLSA